MPSGPRLAASPALRRHRRGCGAWLAENLGTVPRRLASPGFLQENGAEPLGLASAFPLRCRGGGSPTRPQPGSTSTAYTARQRLRQHHAPRHEPPQAVPAAGTHSAPTSRGVLKSLKNYAWHSVSGCSCRHCQSAYIGRRKLYPRFFKIDSRQRTSLGDGRRCE